MFYYFLFLFLFVSQFISAQSIPYEAPFIGNLNLPGETQYNGLIWNGLAHGLGTIRFANGDQIDGNFIAGHPHGIMHIIFANNSGHYTGRTNGRRPHGHGTWFYQNNETLTGNWLNGEAHGVMTRTLTNGNQQEEEWIQGLPANIVWDHPTEPSNQTGGSTETPGWDC